MSPEPGWTVAAGSADEPNRPPRVRPWVMALSHFCNLKAKKTGLLLDHADAGCTRNMQLKFQAPRRLRRLPVCTGGPAAVTAPQTVVQRSSIRLTPVAIGWRISIARDSHRDNPAADHHPSCRDLLHFD